MTAGAQGHRPISIEGTGMVCPDGTIAEVPLPPGARCESFPALACPPKPASSDIPSGVLRRLGRAQRMAMIAAHQAVRNCPEAPSADSNMAVAVGTGLAETGQTASFLENMIRKDEAQPQPARFVNSVHNSLASQIAIALKCRGENHTFSHDFISFELALWQAVQTMRAGRADRVVVCGADEVSPYLVAAGLEFNWWTANASGLGAMDASTGDGTLLGEGAAAFLLAPGTAEEQAGHGPWLRAVAVQPLPGRSVESIVPSREVDFLQRTLAAGGSSLDEVDIILVGANGNNILDAAYESVLAAMSARTRKPVRAGTYKGICGEFCTAAAIGLALASETIRRQSLCAGICEIAPTTDAVPAPSNVLLYHLYPTGHHTAILVTR